MSLIRVAMNRLARQEKLKLARAIEEEISRLTAENEKLKENIIIAHAGIKRIDRERDALRADQKAVFFAGFSAGYSSCSAGLPGLTHNKERDYEVWRCREAELKTTEG